MIAAARIARRLVRKIVKPAALWLNALQLRDAEEDADFYKQMRDNLVVVEKKARVRAGRLVGRRNEIRTW